MSGMGTVLRRERDSSSNGMKVFRTDVKSHGPDAIVMFCYPGPNL